MATVSEKDVAVIGMACRVAGALSPSQLWDVLISSKHVQSDITRFNTKGYYHPDGGPRKGLTNVRKAYMLEDAAIDKFDNAFFYTMPLEAAAMDPQQRMLLEIAYETIENAGIPLDHFRGTDTAVFAGMEGSEYTMIAGRDVDATPQYLATGTSTCMAANRLSYFYDLSGPSMAIDTACSSTMAAMHQAVRTLQHGDSKMALVCGAKLVLSPDMFVPSSELGFLSPDGKCKSLDASADGYGRGEGVLALLLKPLRLAMADGDPIRAVIKGTRLNQDGRTQGITLPSAEAQKCNMNDLYKELSISPSDVQYLEAHGTGTAAGDPLELSAINAVYKSSRENDDPLIVGSVKSNIGHLESASALASFVKVVQCLEKGLIPAQLHFSSPNPEIDFQSIIVPTQTRPWPLTSSSYRRAAINTFGAGGTNGHAVLEAFTAAEQTKERLVDRPYLFKLSAADDISLCAMASSYAEYVGKVNPDLQDLAHTLLNRRSTLRRSRFFVASELEEAIMSFRGGSHDAVSTNGKRRSRIVFLFTGQGAQWPHMGTGLIKHSSLFRQVLKECDDHLSVLPDGPSWSLVEEFAKAKDSTNIHKAEFSQPLCTALQLGIVALLRSWGVNADAVVGHSSGEIAAAYAARMISMRDAITISYYRGLVLSQAVHNLRGSMCAVGLGEHDASALVNNTDGRVQIAAVNSAASCTLSGDVEAIEEVKIRLRLEKQFCRDLRVDQAYHSHHMLPLAAPYLETLEAAHLAQQEMVASCSMFSSVTDRKLESKDLSPSYWVGNMTSTVRFSSALERCVGDHAEDPVMVEIGPHPALKGPAQEVLRSLRNSPCDYFGTCFRGRNGFESLLTSVGAMIAAGLPVKTETINATEIADGLQCIHKIGRVLTDLPSYSWHHSAGFWAESRLSRNVRFRKFPRHQLLGSRFLEDIPNRPSWRNHLSLKDVPWLQQLKDRGTLELPTAVYILMGMEASRQLLVTDGVDRATRTLSNVKFDKEFPLSEFVDAATTIEVQLVASKQDEVKDSYDFEIFSASSASEACWIRLCSGSLGWSTASKQSSIAYTRALAHDQALFDIASSLETDLINSLRDVTMSQEGCNGSFDGVANKHENYPIDPLVLYAVLALPPLSLSRRNLPTASRLLSIASITVPMHHNEMLGGSFIAEVEPCGSCGSRCDVVVQQDEGKIMLEGLRYQAIALKTSRSVMSSLFFKPVLLPDLTQAAGWQELDLSTLARLITHKWPAGDIVIDAMPEEDTATILDAFNLLGSGRRPYCRSVRCVDQRSPTEPQYVTSVENLGETGQCHLVFSQTILPSAEVSSKLLEHGFLCTSQSHENAAQSPTFEYVSLVTNLQSEPWFLWRKCAPSQTVPKDLACVLFATMPIGPSWAILPRKDHVKLDAIALADFCQRKDKRRFDAVVLDISERSVITTWAGKDLLPWIQTLLEWADTILWVTKSTPTPFANVAGTLLRTLQCEKPSLKVRWLVLDATEGDDGEVWSKQVLQSYNETVDGENELLMRGCHSAQEILRYYPDDDLSICTGLLLPRKTNTAMGDASYSVSFAAPKEPVVLSAQGYDYSTANVLVHVEASVIDIGDIRLFSGEASDQNHRHTYGTFFSGKIHGRTVDTTRSQCVVGWEPHHAHRGKVDYQPEFLLPRKDCYAPEEAACTYATLSIACCIVDGEARARPGETLLVTFDGPLKIAVQQVCKCFSVVMLDVIAANQPDFHITFDDKNGILVNGKRVNVRHYLESDYGKNTIRQIWNNGECKIAPSSVLPIAQLRKVFKGAQQPWSTVLLHQGAKEVVDHVPIYHKPTLLFAPDSYYIIIGGLGGLGRFICTWMIVNGAKHIATISRSGPDQPEAGAAVDAAQASGAKLRVFRGDACDRSTISEILSTLRTERPIKGVLNLAMVLGDAPMESMTGEEWDRAMRVKIESSWILHEETMHDSLDIFILFSSIASVLGNRNQGNYNVANTFLNALAEYRQSLDLPGISIALGAMTDIGILHTLSKPNIPNILTRSGLTQLTRSHLSTILEAAVHESPRRDRALIVTGLEMFERDVNGAIVGRSEPLFWAEAREFAHLQRWRNPYSRDGEGGVEGKGGLRARVERAKEGEREGVKRVVGEAFVGFLAGLLGCAVERVEMGRALSGYGIDSLSGVSCQYWFHRELGVDLTAGKILGGASIEEIVDVSCEDVMGGG